MDEKISDEELMLLYGGGDADAFEKLYRRNKDSLYRFMFRLCGNESITEELFQDVWLKVINARHRYQPSAAFRTYLYQIARNCIIDHFRYTSRTPQGYPASEAGVIDLIPEREQKQPEYQAEIRQTTDLLLSVIETLPSGQREAFLLKEEAGMTVQEIAKITGVNVETAKSRLRYAVKKIRTEMVIEHD